MADTTGELDIRAQHWEKVVTGFALQSYVLKDLCSIRKSSAWTESYYVETAADLTAGAGMNVSGVPRLANYPYGEVSWTLTSSRLIKHGMEGVVSWEDANTNNVDVIARTLLRIARAVAKSVDASIMTAIDAATTNTVTITAAYEWDSATVANRDPIQDILNAISELQIDNYDPYTNGYLLVSPKDYANLLGNSNVRNAGQFWSDGVTKNGRVGKICGLTIVVSNSTTTDKAYVIIAKESMTWQSAAPLTVKSIEDAGIKTTIRAFEVGVVQVVNPLAICVIDNTQK